MRVKDEGNYTRAEEINGIREWWERKRRKIMREKERGRGRGKGKRGR